MFKATFNIWLSLSVDVFVLLELAPVATGFAVFVESCSLEFCCRVFSTDEDDGYGGTETMESSLVFIWTEEESWNDADCGCGAGEDCGDLRFALRDAWRLVISGMMLLLDTPRLGTVASPMKGTVMTSFVHRKEQSCSLLGCLDSYETINMKKLKLWK